MSDERVKRTRNCSVDIIINNHNYGEFVAEAIESGLAQEYQRCVVTVVDDGSTDNSADVLARYRDRVTVISKPKGGQASAVNAGIDASVGDLVLFLDADDLLDPGLVPRVVEAFQRQPETAKVQFPLRRSDRLGNPMPGFVPAKPERMRQGDVREALVRYNDDLAWSPMSGNAYPRWVLERIMPIPTEDYPTIGADIYLINLAPLYGPVISLTGPGGSYRVHGRNADFRPDYDRERSARIVELSHVTHGHIARHAHDLDLAVPVEGVGAESVTLLAQEMALASFGADRRFSTARCGLWAIRRRHDLSMRTRVTYAGWMIVMAIAPKSVARTIARLTLR